MMRKKEEKKKKKEKKDDGKGSRNDGCYRLNWGANCITIQIDSV